MSKSAKFPDVADLTRTAGITLPADFLKLLRLSVSRNPRDPGTLTDPCMGIRLAGPWEACALTGKFPASREIRHPQTPPELVPFATQNVDGVHYGFIARTPELPADDYLVGEFCPMDSDSVCFLEATFREAIENLASQHLSFLADDEEELPESAAADLAAIAKVLKVSPSPKKAGRQFTRDGDARPLPASKPRGYHFRKTLDGVGVLAPKSTFSAKTPRSDPHKLSAGLKAAAQSLKSGLYATALAILKDLWWMQPELHATKRIAPLLSESYLALSRPAFAAVIGDKLSRLAASENCRRTR